MQIIFKGKITKDKESKFWLAEALDFDIMTQGTSKEDAAFMLKDAIMEMLTEVFYEKFLQNFVLDSHFYKWLGNKQSGYNVVVLLNFKRILGDTI